MITIFNRQELYVTFDMKKFNELRSSLEQAGIEYTYRTVSQNGSAGIAPNNRSRMGSMGVHLEKDLEYQIYVKKSDYEKARLLTGKGGL